MRAIPAALVDTNVASNLADCATNSEIKRIYEPIYQTIIEPSIALASFEEIEYGMLVARWGAKRIKKMQTILGQMELIVPTRDIALLSASLRARSRQAGRNLAPPDAWIAATALHYELPLLTDDADLMALQEFGLQVLAGT